MRIAINSREFCEAGKIVQEKILYDDIEKKYYHERYENGRKVHEWTTDGSRK